MHCPGGEGKDNSGWFFFGYREGRGGGGVFLPWAFIMMLEIRNLSPKLNSGGVFK